MLDFGDAQKKILQAAGEREPHSRERVNVGRAVGRVLAEEVVSPVDVPSHDYSAMDGYAVSTGDFVAEGPVTLPVLGECAAGHPGVLMRPGACARIFTGAHIPPGADAVIMQENAEREGDSVKFSTRPASGDHIRRAGEDLKQGQVVLERGARLNAFRLGLLASVDRSEVLVASRPRVTILCTGDELRPAGNTMSGGLAESNSVALAALVEGAGGACNVAPIVRDNKEALRAALTAARAHSDVVVTVGGVSVGDHDLVAPMLSELGADIIFHKVAIKPGKPILFAEWKGTLVLGLPGNPSSAQVTFALFGVPLLRALQRDSSPLAERRSAVLKCPFRQKPGRTGFYRARLTGTVVELFSNQASGASTSMAWSNALVVIEANVASLEAGDSVSVIGLCDL